MLKKEQILSAQDVKIEPVAVPEWGGEIFVREFSGRSRAEVIAFLSAKKKAGEEQVEASVYEVFPLVIRLAACDDKGQLLFDASDIETLKDRNGKALERVALAAMKLNGLTKGAGEEAKATF